MRKLPAVQIDAGQIHVTLDGVPLLMDENYIIARQGFWKAWASWRFRPWRITRAWADRNTHYIEFRYPPPFGSAVTIERRVDPAPK